ncbi:MAG: immunoglobulin domain-containing protein [Bdellovibrionales bacterium]
MHKFHLKSATLLLAIASVLLLSTGQERAFKLEKNSNVEESLTDEPAKFRRPEGPGRSLASRQVESANIKAHRQRAELLSAHLRGKSFILQVADAERLQALREGRSNRMELRISNDQAVVVDFNLNQTTATGRYLHGEVADLENSRADLTFHNGNLGGTLTIGSSRYVITTLASQLFAVVEVDTSKFGILYDHPIRSTKTSVDADPDSGVQNLSAQNSVFVSSDGVKVFNVVAAYTPGARDRWGGASQIETQIQNEINAANLANFQSGVRVYYNIAKMLVTASNWDTSTADHFTRAVNQLINETDGIYDEVHQALKDHNGHLALLWVPECQTTTTVVGTITYTSSVCGLGQVPGTFSAVGSNAVGTFANAHELGHNFGADHDDYSLNGRQPYFAAYAKGRRFGCGGVSCFSIMAYNRENNDVQIGLFTSPNLTYARSGQNYTTGSSTEDNVRAMNEQADIKAAAFNGTGNSNVAPTIVSFTGSVTVASGSPLSLSVSATGNPAPSFQWYKNGAELAGATSATYQVSAASAQDAGTYAVQVYNSAGSITSNNATVTVTSTTVTQQPPAITSLSPDVTIDVGQILTLTVQATGNPAPSYQWYKDGVAISGATNNSFSKAVTASDQGAYAVHIRNSAGSTTSANVVVTVRLPQLVPPTIRFLTQGPFHQTLGSALHLYVFADGSPAPTYQWYRNGVAIAGATTYEIKRKAVTAADQGTYAVRVSNSAGAITSINITVTVATAHVAPTVRIVNKKNPLYVGNTLWLAATVTGNPSPTVQWYKNNIAIAGANAVDYIKSNAAEDDSATYSVQAMNVVGSASATMSLTVSTATQAPTRAQVLGNGVTGRFRLGGSIQLQGDANGNPAPRFKWFKDGVELSTNISADTRFYTVNSATAADAGNYAVYAYNSAGGIASENYLLRENLPGAAPTIIAVSADQTLALGETLKLTVDGQGRPGPTAQWYKDGVVLGGAVGAVFTKVATIEDSGLYTVQLKNQYGSVISRGISVRVTDQVLVSPSITLQPVSQSIHPNATLVLRVKASGRPAPMYQWFKNGKKISGATSEVYTKSSTTEDSGYYAVSVYNSQGHVASKVATVVVGP